MNASFSSRDDALPLRNPVVFEDVLLNRVVIEFQVMAVREISDGCYTAFVVRGVVLLCRRRRSTTIRCKRI